MIPVGEGPVARGTDATTPHLARVTRAGGGDVPGGQFLGEFPSVEIQASGQARLERGLSGAERADPAGPSGRFNE